MAEKALHKIQHTFMIKILNKQRIEKLFQHSKATYKKSKANIILNGEKVKKKKKSISPKIRNEKDATFTTSIQHSIGSSS